MSTGAVVLKKFMDEYCINDVQSSTAKLLAGLKMKVFPFVFLLVSSVFASALASVLFF